jgi:hypothetical protein
LEKQTLPELTEKNLFLAKETNSSLNGGNKFPIGWEKQTLDLQEKLLFG